MDQETIETHPNDALSNVDLSADPMAAFTSQRESIIADLLKGQVADAPPPPPAAPKAEPAPTPAATPAADDKAALFARIAAMDAEIAALKRTPATPVAAPAKQAKTSLSVEELRYNPMAALKEAGINPEVLAQFMVAEHAGANAPVDFRVQAALMPQLGALQASMNERTAALQARLDEFEQKSRLEAYEASLNQFVSGVSTEAFPLIARASKADADGVLEDILDVVHYDAQRRAAAGESGPPMSHEEAAKMVEARYAALSKRLAATDPATSTTATTASPQGGPSVAGKSAAPPATMSSLSRVTANSRPKSLEEIEEEIKLELIRKASQPA